VPGATDAKSGHRQRLKDKFLADGLSKFTHEEIVELLLAFGTPRKDTKLAARALLQKMGSIRAVFEASPLELATVEGVGRSNIVAIKFIDAVAGQYLEQRLLGHDYLLSSKKVFQYLRHHMENLGKEVFKVIYLDSAGGVLALEDGGRGTVDTADVHPREVIERALAHRAVGLVFAHNHPSGRIEPSPADYRMTRRLIHAAYLVEMKVYDHLIVGKGEDYYSFRDHGHLARFEYEINHFYNTRG
jgi:DNA repair protein RadC